MYGLAQVYHTIHVVLVDERVGSNSKEMYINNTADWATYNFIYNQKWEVEVIESAVESKEKKRQQIEQRERAVVVAAKEKRIRERVEANERRKERMLAGSRAQRGRKNQRGGR
jgi:hypothetical protein